MHEKRNPPTDPRQLALPHVDTRTDWERAVSWSNARTGRKKPPEGTECANGCACPGCIAALAGDGT